MAQNIPDWALGTPTDTVPDWAKKKPEEELKKEEPKKVFTETGVPDWAQTKPEQKPEQKPEDVGFMARAGESLKQGVGAFGESAKGREIAALKEAGKLEEAQKMMDELKAGAAKPGTPTLTAEDIQRIAREKGLLPAGAKVPSYIVEQVLKSGPEMLVPLVAGSATTMATTPFLGPLGPVIGAAVGIGAYGYEQYGHFMERQALEKKFAKDLDPTSAKAAAAITAPIGYAVDRFTAGLGGAASKKISAEVLKDLAKRRAAGEIGTGAVAKTVGKAAARGVGEGVLGEAPVEVWEAVAERYQAGLPLDNEDAKRDYFEAFWGATAIGGTIGGGSRAYSTYKEYRDLANATNQVQAQQAQDTQQPKEKKGRADTIKQVWGRIDAKAKELEAQRAKEAAAAAQEAVTEPVAPSEPGVLDASTLRTFEINPKSNAYKILLNQDINTPEGRQLLDDVLRAYKGKVNYDAVTQYTESVPQAKPEVTEVPTNEEETGADLSAQDSGSETVEQGAGTSLGMPTERIRTEIQETEEPATGGLGDTSLAAKRRTRDARRSKAVEPSTLKAAEDNFDAVKAEYDTVLANPKTTPKQLKAAEAKITAAIEQLRLAQTAPAQEVVTPTEVPETKQEEAAKPEAPPGFEWFTETNEQGRVRQGFRRIAEPSEEVAPAETVEEAEPTDLTLEEEAPVAVEETEEDLADKALRQQGKTLAGQLRAIDPYHPLIPDLVSADVDESVLEAARETINEEVANKAARKPVAAEEVDAAVSADQETDAQVDALMDEIERTRRSETAGTARTPTTVQAVQDTLESYFPSAGRLKSLVRVVQSAKDLPQKVRYYAKISPNDARTQAFTHNGRVYLISDNIAAGSEMAVFMHEVGVHLGLPKLIGRANFISLANQVAQWSTSTQDSLETNLAQRAKERAESAKQFAQDRNEPFNQDDYNHELIAYFVEEAINAGINPVALQEENLSKDFKTWIRKFVSALKAGLRKIGFNNFEKLTANDILNLVYGAADLQVSGAFHGTAADFRKFSHAYMGAGEGAQAFGWGTYLAQRPGIAREYMVQEANRKTRANNSIRAEEGLGITEPIPVKLIDRISGRELAPGMESYIRPRAIMQAAGNAFPKVYVEVVSQDPTRGFEQYTQMIDLSNIKTEDGQRLAEISKIQKLHSKILERALKGSFMTVRPLVPEFEMLDRDARIEDQSPYVKQQLAKLERKLANTPFATLVKDFSGGIPKGDHVYNALRELASEGYDAVYNLAKMEPDPDSTDAQQVASMALDNIGIGGLKFFDQPSRLGLGILLEDRTRNFVIFNDKNLTRISTKEAAEDTKIRFSRNTEYEDLYKQTGLNQQRPKKESEFDRFKSSPVETTSRLMDKMRSYMFSFDFAINKKILAAMRSAGATVETMSKAFYELQISQALRADSMADLFLEKGSIAFDPELVKFIITESETSMKVVRDSIDALGKKYGVSEEDFRKYSSAAFIAQRSKGLNKANAKLQRDVLELAANGKRDQAKKRLNKRWKLVHMTDAEIKAGMEFFKKFPELQDVFETWNDVREKTLNFAQQQGLYTAETVNELLDVMDYVPFYRIEQIEAEAVPKQYTRGLLDTLRDKAFKGSHKDVNDIFDNMERWTRYMIKKSMNNAAAQQKIKWYKAYLPEDIRPIGSGRSETGNTVSIWENGKLQRYEFQGVDGETMVKGFTGLEPVVLNSAGTILNFLRQSANFQRVAIVANPIFSIMQVPMDLFTAMFTSGVRYPLMLPLQVMKEIPASILGMSKARATLKETGTVGRNDLYREYRAFDVAAQQEVKKLKTVDKILKAVVSPLHALSIASDNVVRQAVYNQVLLETKNKARAANAAEEIINFRRTGSSGLITIFRQFTPFVNANLQALHVSLGTMMGSGINDTTRAEAFKRVMATGAQIAAVSFLYAAMKSGDDDYEKLDPAERDRFFIMNGTFKVPMRNDIFTLLFKVIPEHTYNYLIAKSEDGSKMQQAFKTNLMRALAVPSPVPTLLTPLIEAGFNIDTVNNRPLLGAGQEGIEAELQFSTKYTTEAAKLLGENSGLSPIVIDNFLRDWTGSVGVIAATAMSEYIAEARGVVLPEKTMKETLLQYPFFNQMLVKDVGSRNIADYYELRAEVNRVVNSYNRQNGYDFDGARRYLHEDSNLQKYNLRTKLNYIQNEISGMRKYERFVRENKVGRFSDPAAKAAELRRIEAHIQQMLGYARQIDGREVRNIQGVREQAGM